MFCFCRSCGNIDDSVIVLSLMEFLSVFSESHLEKCVALANNHSNDSNNNSEVWKESISVFFEELVAMTVSTMEPAVSFVH